MATTSGSNKNGNSNTVKAVSNPSAGVSYASQGAVNSDWNDYIIKTVQKLESEGKKVYTSIDETGSLHYSTKSQTAANNTAAKYDTSLSAYTSSKTNQALSILAKGGLKGPDQVNTAADSTNSNNGAVLPGSSDIQTNMYGKYQSDPSLDTSNPFGFFTDRTKIQQALDKATNDAYALKAKEANRGLVSAENTAYANTNNAVADIRRALAGSAATGANRGSAAATALQSLLGLGQQNNELVTTGLQSIMDVADQKAAALSENANKAIDISNNAKNLQSNSATSVYSSDATMWSELTSALSSLTSSLNTDYANDKMNAATNATNESIAKMQSDAQIKAAELAKAAQEYAARKGQTSTITNITKKG